MTSQEDRKIAEKIAERLRTKATQPVKRIIFYGSRAAGTARPESDFDFMVVEKDPVSKRDEMRKLRQSLDDFPYCIDAWVMGEAEFDETKHVIGGLAYPANKYGSILYEIR